MNIPDIQKASKTLTTDGSGDASEAVGPFRGWIDRIDYTKVDFATGVDFNIVDAQTGEDLWNEDNVEATEVDRPGGLVQDRVGVNTSQYDRHWIDGNVTVVVANGGDTKTGTFEIWAIAG